MDTRGEAASLSVQEAMKSLNMTKFTAEELNTKFQYRVQSITRGLGGSLEHQKSIYTAWEYLNRMLARETSNETEEVLKKVDKSVKLLENPKQLDMIPVRLNNASKKASLIIQKETEPDEKNKLRNLRVQRNSLKNKDGRREAEEEKLQDLEKSLGVSALPGQLLQKHIKWVEQDQLKSKRQIKQLVVERMSQDQVDQKGRLARLNNAPQKRPKKDLTTQQLKEIVRMDRNVSSREESSVLEKEQQLGKMLDKLPKLPRTQSQALLFKRTTVLNEMFENPRKPSKYDQRSAAQRAAWKEKADRILSDRPDSAKRPKSSAKTKLRKAARRSVSKQPVEQMLYRKLNVDQAEASELASADIEPTTLPTRPRNSPTFSAPGSTRPKNNPNPNLITHGPFTPSRILKWIKSAQDRELRE